MNRILKTCLMLLALASSSASACLPPTTEQLKSGDRDCYEIMFTKEHVDCMNKHYDKLKEAIVGHVKRVMAKHSLEERKAADKKVYADIEKVTVECRKKQAEFGPGSLGERKRVYCLNEGMKKLLSNYN